MISLPFCLGSLEAAADGPRSARNPQPAVTRVWSLGDGDSVDFEEDAGRQAHEDPGPGWVWLAERGLEGVIDRTHVVLVC
jgi:hypothetical protein